MMVVMMTSLPAADCSTFLPLRREKLDRQWFGDGSKSMSVLSKTFIGGAVCSEFESEVPAAEEMLDRGIGSREQFSFQMCLETGDGSGTFHNWRQRVPDSWCRDTECLGLD